MGHADSQFIAGAILSVFLLLAPAFSVSREAQHAPSSPQQITEVKDEQSAGAASLVNPAEDAKTPSTDLWQRIRAGFTLTIPQKRRINQEISWLTNNPRYLQRVQQRARPYLHFITQEVAARDMPLEIALLPIVESSFQPFAYSPGQAAGIWQFIPATARAYGLKQNWWYDGRRDIVASTRAALKFLEHLAGRYAGDWKLALAAYNAGAGTVNKAIRKNRRNGKSTDFWSLQLPKETSAYVPRLLAIAALVSDPEQHNLHLEPIPNEPFFVEVNIGAQVDLARAAELADISIVELYRLNPAFNHWATDPDGPHRLLLPTQQGEVFQQRLAELDPDQRVQWKRYKIKEGDSLSVIAKRHGTTVAVLMQVNNLRGARIRAGKHLLFPVAVKKLSHYTLSAPQRKAKRQHSRHGGKRATYVVQNGDTLWDIAQAHHVNHKHLAQWNGVSPKDLLQPGQQLVVSKKAAGTPAKDSTAPSGIQPVLLDAGPPDTVTSLFYRVRKGDSLARIAQRFNVTVNDLRRWNSLRTKYLQPGDKLKLVVDVTKTL